MLALLLMKLFDLLLVKHASTAIFGLTGEKFLFLSIWAAGGGFFPIAGKAALLMSYRAGSLGTVFVYMPADWLALARKSGRGGVRTSLVEAMLSVCSRLVIEPRAEAAIEMLFWRCLHVLLLLSSVYL